MNSKKIIAGKTIEEWVKQYPILKLILTTQEVFWLNPAYQEQRKRPSITIEKIQEAERRFQRFAPFIATVFPETAPTNGIIESDLVPIPQMKKYLEAQYQQPLLGNFWVKCDGHLPISGSIKSRGGIHEVLKYAETLALQNHLITVEDSYQIFASEKLKNFFSQYTIIVGSTGNLGLSIGIMSAKIGFQVIVHMSADAKEWKKDLLRQNGVTVIEHASDFSKAVEEGRKQAETIPNAYFVDDENSIDLFLGYAVAANRLKRQLEEKGIIVDQNHPLFVYLPCGVGGSPGGITYGLKMIYGEHVHCFFAEPTHSPCMLLGLLTGLNDQIHVHDFGIDNQTEADGLAVGRPSRFVSHLIPPYLSGIFTIKDQRLFTLLCALIDTEKIPLEPSALAGMFGPVQMMQTKAGNVYRKKQLLDPTMKQSNHIIWATGGSMVPPDEMEMYYQRGAESEKKHRNPSLSGLT